MATSVAPDRQLDSIPLPAYMSPRHLFHVREKTMQSTTMVESLEDFERSVEQETNEAQQLPNTQMFVVYFVVIWRVSGF